MYKLLRLLLFRLDAETSHRLAFTALDLLHRLPGASRIARSVYAGHVPSLPVSVMGLTFPNPVGLAAGLDKNAEHVRPLSDFGFGFLELGTVTPRPQPGNPRPRMFRLVADAALINRMGFNNVGAEKFIANLAARGKPCPIGINIGKNRDTPMERAADDYLAVLNAVYRLADYVAVNISSPNTPGLRDLQAEHNLEELLHALKTGQAALAEQHGRYVPIALKIAPDLDDGQVDAIARLVVEYRFDAVIATNTTVTRPGLEHEPLSHQAGGLSGRPLKPLATGIIRKLYAHLQGKVPIVGVGGIETADDAWDKLIAGADLVQVYTALIYRGPDIVSAIARGLAERVRQSGCRGLPEAVRKARQQRNG